MHFFTTESRSGRNVVAYGSMNPVDVPRRRALELGGHRRPFTWCGVFVSRMAISHCFCKLASAGGWWKLTDRHCLDCPLHAWRASKVNPQMFLQKHAVLAGTNSNLHESVFVKHPGNTQKRWQSIIALFSFHKGPPNFRRRRPPYKMNASWKSAPICSPRRQFGAKLCEYVPLIDYQSKGYPNR